MSMKLGLSMRLHHDLQTHLSRKSDCMGSFERMLIINSSCTYWLFSRASSVDMIHSTSELELEKLRGRDREEEKNWGKKYNFEGIWGENNKDKIKMIEKT